MEIKAILNAFKDISERLRKLESIGIPKDGKDGLPGKDGKDGVNGLGFAGAQGRPGKKGEDGISVVDAKVNNKGHLIVTLSNGEKIDAGYVGSGGGTGNVSSDTVSIIWTGTKEEYNALPEHSSKTLYFILQSKPEPEKPVYNKFRYNSGVKYNG